MTATDELRRLLDERGADYRMRQSVTNGSMNYYDRYTVLIDGNPHALIDTGNDDDVVLTLRCTPEQAITATLGAPERTCHITALGLPLSDFPIGKCSNCGCGADVSSNYCWQCGAKVVEQ